MIDYFMLIAWVFAGFVSFWAGHRAGKAEGVRWASKHYKSLIMDCVKEINKLNEEKHNDTDD